MAASITRTKFYFLIVTYNAGRTQAGLPSLSMYPHQFTIVDICPVDSFLVMSKLFGSVNEVDSHNKSRHFYLDLDKLWVTQCGCLRLCTTVTMGMTITNIWRLF